MIKTLGRALPLILAAMGFALAFADAQTLPWPSAPGGGAAAPAPMTASPPPMMAPPTQAMQPPPGQALQSPPGQGPQQQCIEQFTILRTAAEKSGANARTGSEHRVSREEMCKLVSAYAVAATKWAKFTTDNVTKCGIPPQIAKKLQEEQNHALLARKNLCSTGTAAAPAAPTLSEALGTARLPVPDGSQSGSGTLDTLTGNAIAR